MKIRIKYYKGDEEHGNVICKGESLVVKGKMTTDEFVELAKKIPPIVKLFTE